MTADATIMIVTFNRAELTKRMLNSLLERTKRPFNLVIVDNGSSDDTHEYLVKWLAGLSDTEAILSTNSENKGIAVGRNQALKIADETFPESKWLCTLDNDVEMPEGWLTECIDILQANTRYGMLGVNMEGKPYPIVTENGKTFQRKPVGNLGTACMVFPKSVHKMLGFFNTEYGKYGEEDADWGMRARVVGYQMGYIERMGTHFGEGENDVGPYREYKTACHKNNLAKFNANCRAYAQRTKPIYIPYKEE